MLFEKLDLSLVGAPGNKPRKGFCNRRRKRLGTAEVTMGFLQRKAREACRLVERGDAVGAFDLVRYFGRQRRRQIETHVDSIEQRKLESFVVESDRSFERTDEIADYVLGRIMQKRCEAPTRRPIRI